MPPQAPYSKIYLLFVSLLDLRVGPGNSQVDIVITLDMLMYLQCENIMTQ